MRLLALCCTVLVACGAPAAPDDADDRGDASDAPSSSTLTPPLPPDPPRFPCPPGWRAATVLDTPICEPFATDVTPTCGPDELLLPGRGCEPIAPCPTGAWPDSPPAGAVFVSPGAIGGDGSPARPYGGIAEALGAAPGRPLVLGEGTFTQPEIRIRTAVEIVGLCPHRTHIVATAGARSAVYPSAPVTLRNLSVDAPEDALVTDSRLTLDGVRIDGTATIAMRVLTGGMLDGRRVRAFGRGTDIGREATLMAGPGSVTVLRDSMLGGAGPVVYGMREGDAAASVTVQDSSIVDAAVISAASVSVSLHRVAIERVGVGVLFARGQHAELIDVRARHWGSAGWLINGDTHIERVCATDGESQAIYVAPEFGAVTGSDLVVARVTANAVFLTEGGPSDLERVVVGDVSGTAISVQGGATWTLRDLRVAGTSATDFDGNTYGIGLLVLGAELLLDRASIEGAALEALAVEDGSAMVEDLAVHASGRGVAVRCRSAGCPIPTSLTLTRATVSDSARGLAVFGGSATLTDLEVSGTRRVPDDWLMGFGVLGAADGTITGTRVRARGIEGIGVGSVTRALVDITGLEVFDTAPIDCPDCGGTSYFGDNLVCGAEGRVRVRQLDSYQAQRAGFAEAEGCTEIVLEGRIHHNAIGVLSDLGLPPRAFAEVLVDSNGLPSAQQSVSLSPADIGL